MSPNFRQALEHFSNAEYPRASALLHNSPEEGAAWLRATIALRNKDFTRVTNECSSSKNKVSTRESNVLALVASQCALQSGDITAYTSRLKELEHSLKQRDDDFIRGWIASTKAVHSLISRDISTYESEVHKIENTLRLVEHRHFSPFVMLEGPALEARLLSTKAVEARINGDLEKAEKLLLEALLKINLLSPRDFSYEASIAGNLVDVSECSTNWSLSKYLQNWEKTLPISPEFDAVREELLAKQYTEAMCYGQFEPPSVSTFGSLPGRLSYLCNRVLFGSFDSRKQYDEALDDIEHAIDHIAWFDNPVVFHRARYLAVIVCALRKPQIRDALLVADYPNDPLNQRINSQASQDREDGCKFLSLGISAKLKGDIETARPLLERSVRLLKTARHQPLMVIGELELYSVTRSALLVQNALEFTRTFQSPFANRVKAILEGSDLANPSATAIRFFSAASLSS